MPLRNVVGSFPILYRYHYITTSDFLQALLSFLSNLTKKRRIFCAIRQIPRSPPLSSSNNTDKLKFIGEERASGGSLFKKSSAKTFTAWVCANFTSF